MVNFNDVPLDISTGFIKIQYPDKVKIDPSEIVWQDEEYEGFRIIKNKEGKFNYIDCSYFLLSPYHNFMSCARFHEGFAAIYIEGKGVNFISRNGNYLSREWYDYAKSFQDGYGIVGIKGKGETYIDALGNLPFKKKWFHKCCSFKNGFARVLKKDKGWNFINTRGKIISKLYFEDCMDFCNGYACIQYYKAWNYMDSKGRIVSPLIFMQCENWNNGTGKVHLKEENTDFCNLVLPNGGLLSPQLWFHEINAIWGYSGYIGYRKDEGYLIVTGNGKFLIKNWLSYCSWKMYDGTLLVYMKGKGWNYINKKGKFISKLWFEKAYDFNNGSGRVKINGEKFRIDKKGILYPY